jgi:hypothetical protein
MVRDINLTRLIKDKFPVGEDCENCEEPIEVGDAVQIYGDTAYCEDCQRERAEEKGVNVVIHEGSKTRKEKKKKAGKKTARKTAKKERVKKAEREQLSIDDDDDDVGLTDYQEDEVHNLAAKLVNNGMKMLKVKIDAELETAFEFLQSPATGEHPELPTGNDTFIRAIQEAIWDDGWLFKQLNTKNGRVTAHSKADEELDVCPASTASGADCQNKPKAGKTFCGSHKALEDTAVKKTVKKGKKKVKRTELEVL